MKKDNSLSIIVQRVIFTLTTLLLVVMSFSFSNQSGPESGRLSKGLIARTVETEYFNDMPYGDKAQTVKDSDLYVRKGAHFTEYALLGTSLYFFFAAWLRSSRVKPYIFACLACLAYAAGDEFHQVFSSGRTPAFLDVLIDFSGCLLACLVIFLIRRAVIRRRGK